MSHSSWGFNLPSESAVGILSLASFSLLNIANTPEEFSIQVNSCLNEKQPDLTEKGSEFLKENNWQYRVKQMLELIYEKL